MICRGQLLATWGAAVGPRPRGVEIGQDALRAEGGAQECAGPGLSFEFGIFRFWWVWWRFFDFKEGLPELAPQMAIFGRSIGCGGRLLTNMAQQFGLPKWGKTKSGVNYNFTKQVYSNITNFLKAPQMGKLVWLSGIARLDITGIEPRWTHNTLQLKWQKRGSWWIENAAHLGCNA